MSLTCTSILLPAWVPPCSRVLFAPRSKSFTHQTAPVMCASSPGESPHQSDSTPSTLAPTPVASTPIIDTLKQEARRIRANFFYPGHKQGAVVHPNLLSLIGPHVLQADLPELPELDNLFAPEGVLDEAQTLLAETFTEAGSSLWASYFLVNGSTCGVEAAFLSTVRPGRKVILPRNAHQSAVHALILSGAIPVWVDPVYDSDLDLLHGLTPASIQEALEEHHRQVDAVMVVSPTYHGVVSDLKSISQLAHAYGAKCIVDEAHGAHLVFHPRLPSSATSCNADIVVQSVHKTLTAFTQAAVMHVRKDVVNQHRIQSALQMLQSSSPNYLLLASLDATRALMQDRGFQLMENTLKLAHNCAIRIASLEGFDVLGVENHGTKGLTKEGEALVFDYDVTKVTVLLPTHLSGYELDVHLIDRFGVYAELPLFRHVTFAITAGTTQKDIDTLVTSLSLYNTTTPIHVPNTLTPDMMPKWDVSSTRSNITPRDAYFAESEFVCAEDAIGRISADTLCPYPPGIPVLVPGEVINQQSIDILKRVLDDGGSVSGASDEALSKIRVVVQ